MICYHGNQIYIYGVTMVNKKLYGAVLGRYVHNKTEEKP